MHRLAIRILLLGCWHGFIAQQKMISIKKHFGDTKRKYLYLSGWMVAALRSEFGPLPDQSMHEKTSVPALIEELYTFLRQADSRELNLLFRELDAARAASDLAKEQATLDKIENFQTHVVPIIADIDAGFGNAEATYLLAKKMIEAGACALQIENQVSDEKQCGHQDGKVTVPHEDFLAKVRACRYAFLELGVEDGIIVTRTDSLGAGLTKQIAVSHTPGDIGDQYNSFLDCEEIDPATARNGDVIINRNGKMLRPKRLPSNLFQFRPGTGEDRCVLDSITSLQNGADLLWIETEKPHVEQIAGMMDRIREVVPNAKLVYNNSPSFNWTLNFRQQVYDAMQAEGLDVSAYDRADLMSAKYDGTELGEQADKRIRTFQADGAKRAGIFHHLITVICLSPEHVFRSVEQNLQWPDYRHLQLKSRLSRSESCVNANAGANPAPAQARRAAPSSTLAMIAPATSTPVADSMPSRPGDALTSRTKGPRWERSRSTPAIPSPMVLAARRAMLISWVESSTALAFPPRCRLARKSPSGAWRCMAAATWFPITKQRKSPPPASAMNSCTTKFA